MPKPEVLVLTQKSQPVRAGFGCLPGPQAVHVWRPVSTTFGNSHAWHWPDAEKASVLVV
jgi:hypothetical protein